LPDKAESIAIRSCFELILSLVMKFMLNDVAIKPVAIFILPAGD
jgi:hypothetical protein